MFMYLYVISTQRRKYTKRSVEAQDLNTYETTMKFEKIGLK